MFKKKLMILGFLSMSILSLTACSNTSTSKNNNDIKTSNNKPYEFAKDLMTNKRVYLSLEDGVDSIGKDSEISYVFVVNKGNVKTYEGTGLKLKDIKGLSDNEIENKVYNTIKDKYYSSDKLKSYKKDLVSIINSSDDAYKKVDNFSHSGMKPETIVQKAAERRKYVDDELSKVKKRLNIISSLINTNDFKKYIGTSSEGKISVTGASDNSGNNLVSEVVDFKQKEQISIPESDSEYSWFYYRTKLAGEDVAQSDIGNIGGAVPTFSDRFTFNIITPIHGMTAKVYNDSYYSFGTVTPYDSSSETLVTKISNEGNIPTEDQLDSKYIKVKD